MKTPYLVGAKALIVAIVATQIPALTVANDVRAGVNLRFTKRAKSVMFLSRLRIE